MGTNWNEISGDGGDTGSPGFIEESPGVFVAENEEKIYDDPNWAWPEVSQFIEGGM